MLTTVFVMAMCTIWRCVCVLQVLNLSVWVWHEWVGVCAGSCLKTARAGRTASQNTTFICLKSHRIYPELDIIGGFILGVTAGWGIRLQKRFHRWPDGSLLRGDVRDAGCYRRGKMHRSRCEGGFGMTAMETEAMHTQCAWALQLLAPAVQLVALPLRTTSSTHLNEATSHSTPASWRRAGAMAAP